MNNYEDIINLKHHESKFHTRMSLLQRSAQFAPFAALTGFEDEVLETARTTTKKIELDDEQKEIINNKIKDSINKKVIITYFVQDLKKDGGKYITEVCIVKKIDEYEKKLVFDSHKKIKINNVIKISNHEGDV